MGHVHIAKWVTLSYIRNSSFIRNTNIYKGWLVACLLVHVSAIFSFVMSDLVVTYTGSLLTGDTAAPWEIYTQPVKLVLLWTNKLSLLRIADMEIFSSIMCLMCTHLLTLSRNNLEAWSLHIQKVYRRSRCVSSVTTYLLLPQLDNNKWTRNPFTAAERVNAQRKNIILLSSNTVVWLPRCWALHKQKIFIKLWSMPSLHFSCVCFRGWSTQLLMCSFVPDLIGYCIYHNGQQLNNGQIMLYTVSVWYSPSITWQEFRQP